MNATTVSRTITTVDYIPEHIQQQYIKYETVRNRHSENAWLHGDVPHGDKVAAGIHMSRLIKFCRPHRLDPFKVVFDMQNRGGA